MSVNEIIDLARKTKSECLIFKVNFEKAYNSVRRSFVDYMMRRMGFGERWRSWIRVYVFFGNLSMLLNVYPTKEMNI